MTVERTGSCGKDTHEGLGMTITIPVSMVTYTSKMATGLFCKTNIKNS